MGDDVPVTPDEGTATGDAGGRRLTWPAYAHEVLAAVLSVRDGELSVLMWRRGRPPFDGRWALPGGGLGAQERLRAAILRHLAEKVEVREVAHLEQLATHSNVARDPRARVLATAYLGIVPSSSSPELPPDTAWQPVADLPATAFDHADFISAAVDRLRAKLSYTNVGFALAPATFTLSTLRDVISEALGYPVTQTNLARVMTRRDLIEPTGSLTAPGRSGGRPGMTYRFRSRTLAVTDPFAVLRPPRPVAGGLGGDGDDGDEAVDEGSGPDTGGTMGAAEDDGTG